jgi:branched-chain amino acid transport system ATP-binding protein
VAILELRGVTKRFGGLPAVDDLDLDVAPGRVVALIGPNGAGKSTLLQLINGLIAPTTAGAIRFEGRDLLGRSPHEVRRMGVATVMQRPRVFTSMSTLEDVAVGARFGGGERLREGPATEVAAEVLERLGLGARRDVSVAELTLHEQRVLELARALAGRPRLLLLDEVMAGLNPTELTAFVELVRSVRDDAGLTIVWVEHVMRAITALADDVVVLALGRRLAAGSPDEVMRDPRVIEAYLGRGAQRC